MNLKELPVLDVLIVGAGPIGLACGIEASKRGLNYLIVEKGCLVNSIYHYPVNMTFFSTSERLEIGGVPFISHGDKPTRREALDYYRRVVGAYQLCVNLYEKVLKISRENKHYRVITEKNSYLSANLVLCTGFYDAPHLMQVPGEELPKVKHYYDEPHPYAFQDVLVVGAANSAVDVALETFRKGARVTMVIREDRIRDSVKYWVKPDIENRIKEGAIKAYFNSEVTHIRQHEVDIRTPQGLISIPNNFVLAMTGYQPNFELLQMAGVQLSDNNKRIPVYNPDTQESNQPGLFLAGVICGGMDTSKWFIENTIVHAERIMKAIAKK